MPQRVIHIDRVRSAVLLHYLKYLFPEAWPDTEHRAWSAVDEGFLIYTYETKADKFGRLAKGELLHLARVLQRTKETVATRACTLRRAGRIAPKSCGGGRSARVM